MTIKKSLSEEILSQAIQVESSKPLTKDLKGAKTTKTKNK